MRPQFKKVVACLREPIVHLLFTECGQDIVRNKLNTSTKICEKHMSLSSS